MIQLEQQQHGEFVVGGGVCGRLTPTTYTARWGWIKKFHKEIQGPHVFFFTY